MLQELQLLQEPQSSLQPLPPQMQLSKRIQMIQSQQPFPLKREEPQPLPHEPEPEPQPPQNSRRRMIQMQLFPLPRMPVFLPHPQLHEDKLLILNTSKEMFDYAVLYAEMPVNVSRFAIFLLPFWNCVPGRTYMSVADALSLGVRRSGT